MSKLLKPFIPLFSKITGHKAWKYHKNYVKNDFKDKEKREEEQWNKLKEIINHAYENVPFYREKFDEAGITPEDIESREDLQKIPITTKPELRKNFPDKLIAKNYRNKKIRFTNTSGTTGRITKLVQDKDDVNHKYAAKLWSRKLYGVDIGEKVLRITPNECQPAKKEGKGFESLTDYFKEFLRNPTNSTYAVMEKIVKKTLHRKKTLPPIAENDTDIKEEVFEEYIRKIKKEKPDLLAAYPLYLKWFSEFIEENDLEPPELEKIDLVGGLSTENMREEIEKSFDAETFQNYGGCEWGRYGAECSHEKGWMHILEEHCYVEFIKPDGTNANDGELSNLIVTSLTNYGMPLIRVEHGDIGYYTDEKCSCGRTGRRMKVKGRIQSVIMDRRGIPHMPGKIWDAIHNIDGIDHFQLEQLDREKISLKVVSEEGFNRSRLKEKIKEIINGVESIRIREVDKIESEGSNKYMLVKSSTHDDFRPLSIRKRESEIN